MAERIPFRGHRVCSCVAESLPLVEKVMLARGLINESIDLVQGGYRTDVAASAGTHSRGGCCDVLQYSEAQIAVWRFAGWTMQRRYRSQGFDPHAHGWPAKCEHLSPGARDQAWQWDRGMNGLASRGAIEGPWPVVDWRTGIQRMERELTAFADEITDQVTRRVLAEVGEKLLTKDGIISNTFTDNPENPQVTLKTAIEQTGIKLSRLADDNDTTDSKIAELVKSQRVADAAHAAQIAALTKSVSDLAAVVATMTIGGSDGPIPGGQ